MKTSPANVNCSFAERGTYGHECGRPAVVMAVKKSFSTASGLFYTGRCKAHSERTDGEGAGVLRYEAINVQTNTWL